MNALYDRTARLGRLLFSLLAAWLIISGGASRGQTLTLNVTNFGAVGDAVQFWANTTSNSVLVTTTNQLSVADIGKSIEIFGAGPVTTPPNCQDMVATITNVVNGTNIFVSQVAHATLANAFATCGHNNQVSFQAAITACGAATNAIINIPAGKYLMLPAAHTGVYGYSSMLLSRGGITLAGAGMSNTVLLNQGAWTLQGSAAWRGFLLEINPPIANDYPFTIQNLTLDGGLLQGNTANHNSPASTTDGTGWDETSDAIVEWGSGNTFTHATWTNVMFTHWRGEMVKSLDQSTNGNLNIFTCAFNDGNATAINIYPSLNISNCLFNNLFQVAEYYQQYSVSANYFQNNVCTNITGNSFAVNGGSGVNPPFIIQNNVFSISSANGIETVPADNLSILNNTFYCADYSSAIVLGAPGYQGTFCNSNITIAGNTVYNPFTFVDIASGSSAADPQRVVNVNVYNNTLANPDHAVSLLLTYGWSTNVHFWSNNCSQTRTGGVNVNSGANGNIYSLIDTNNLYYTLLNGNAGVTTYLSYRTGSKYSIAITGPNAVVLQDSDASQIPVGAQMVIANNTAYPASAFPVYLNSAMTSGPVTLPVGQSAAFFWTNGVWMSASMIGTLSGNLSAPTDLRVISSGN